MRQATTLASACLLMTLASCGPQRSIDRGLQFLELGDVGRAIEQFSQAVNAAPRNAQAHYQLARAYCRCDSAALAVAEYRILCQLDPSAGDDVYLRQMVAGFIGLEPYPATRLTATPGNDAFPAFSPDGQLIAFSSKRDGDPEIYLMQADGGDPRRLTTHRGVDFAPAFSPDGGTIAFVSDRDGNDEVYLHHLTSGRDQRLTYNKADDELPRFSPDGSEVLFISDRDGRYQIYGLGIRGAGSGAEAGLRRLFDDRLNKIFFSVHNSKLLVQEERENRVALFLAAFGDQAKQTVDCPSFRAGLPTVLSPDGSALLMVSSREGNDELYLYGLTDRTLVRLTADPGQDFGFGFSPDGRLLLFDSTRGGDRDVYLMHLDRLIGRQELLKAIPRI